MWVKHFKVFLGAIENAGVENAGALKMQGVEKAGVENTTP